MANYDRRDLYTYNTNTSKRKASILTSFNRTVS